VVYKRGVFRRFTGEFRGFADFGFFRRRGSWLDWRRWRNLRILLKLFTELTDLLFKLRVGYHRVGWTGYRDFGERVKIFTTGSEDSENEKQALGFVVVIKIVTVGTQRDAGRRTATCFPIWERLETRIQEIGWTRED
jgi:hypothetical protein